MSFSFSNPRMKYEDIEDEVANMSLEERDAARGDLYGERPPIRENDEMIENALQELEESIESIDSNKEAYETAQVICPEYVNSREFRLMFLRCERFDVPKAALRIITYWEMKVDVWGEDKSFHRLTIDDFGEEDQTALRLGGFKFLPELDNAGRGIIFRHRAMFDSRRTHRNSMCRLVWYISEAALDDVNIQRNGTVVIAYFGMPSYDRQTVYDSKLERKFVKIARDGLPIRLVACHHIISSSPILKLITEHALYWFGSKWRARYKQHSCIKDEYMESFAEYGIEQNMLPQVLGGDLEFDYGQWLNNRRARGR